MLKVMGQIVRRPDLSLDAFRLHWRTTHRGLALRLAHSGLLRGYVQNHRLDIDVEGLVPVAGAPSRRECASLLKAMLFVQEDADMLSPGDAVRFSVHRRSSAEATVPLSSHARVETSWWRSLDDFAAA
ncbi:hypothetical protein DM806_26560 [Sphingobium lactosutens]|uniref:EthD domain-containing protein n=1 Tax=Sphingobium lactosutens TaxID=522773 RepID=UPI0015BD6762|nr:EthD domain-containing protein [Sphingobium lactosutens]NWK99157.1 hypothetical protein [Sphingobium lactosutens]